MKLSKRQKRERMEAVFDAMMEPVETVSGFTDYSSESKSEFRRVMAMLPKFSGNSAQPANPIAMCGRCLYGVGYGYDRIAGLLGQPKSRVYRWIKTSRSRGEINHTNLSVWESVRPKAGPIKRRYIPRVRKLPKRPYSTRIRKLYLRTKLWQFFKHGLHPKSTTAMVGCNRTELRFHISWQFSVGMEFDNYGLWHLDHITPCCKFDLSKPEEVRQCFHFTNLRPMWALDNKRKSASCVR